MTEYNVFDVVEKKSKDYYSLLVGKKAQPPYIVHTLQRNFNFSSHQIKHFFILPHRVTRESKVKAFQYKVLTSILYTNTKLHKIGFRPNDLCSFCKAHSETLSHFFITVHIPDISGLILSLTGFFYPINGYTALWKTFYMEQHRNNALYLVYSIILLSLGNCFVGLQKKPN